MALSDELWRESAAWLTKCQIIPPDHRINRSDSDIKLFARILRDGVLLCKLVNFLDPNVDPVDFHLRPRDAQVSCCTRDASSWPCRAGIFWLCHMHTRKKKHLFYFSNINSQLDTTTKTYLISRAQFLCLQNINTFLSKCKKHFNIRDADLFEPHMLYDLTNFHRVLNTLSKLSQSKIVQTNHPSISWVSIKHTPYSISISDSNMKREMMMIRERRRSPPLFTV